MNRAEKRRQKKLSEKAAQQTLTLQQALDVAVQQLVAGRLVEAENIYQQILQAAPNQPNALHLLGVVAYRRGKNEVAVDLITKALAIKPDFDEAHNNLGAVFNKLGKRDEAVTSYQKALEINPDYADAHYNLGNVMLSLGRLDEAVTSYHKALAITPDYAGAHYNLGNALKELGKLDEAVASYHKAVAIRSDYAEAHSNLGNALNELGKLDEAVASYHKAVAIAPDYAEAHCNLGTVLKDLGKFDEAEASYLKALAIAPDFSGAQYNLGVALQEQGRIDEAIEYLKRADPETVKQKPSALLLQCYYMKQDRGAFERHLDRISKNQIINFQAACISAFVSHQLGTRNSYKFCDDPVDLVTVYDLLDAGDMSLDLITEMKIELENNLVNEQYEPGHISEGFKSYGNLFLKKFPFIEILEQAIHRCIGSFVQQHDHNQSRLFRDWPTKYVLDGWYIRLLKGGEITAHVHEGWLSGVFYVQVPAEKENDAGNIEFTLHGYDLPVIRDDFPRRIVTSQSGRLVLFPSSLPHRVIPFSTNQERYSIAFDVIPS